MIYSLKKDGEKKLSKHFKVKEFACKDGSDCVIIDDRLVEVLEKIRVRLNCPVNITSGYRTESYNKKVGGASNSYHLKGMAADIQCRGFSIGKIGAIAGQEGANGIGIYNSFVHVDVRDNKYIWGDRQCQDQREVKINQKM